MELTIESALSQDLLLVPDGGEILPTSVIDRLSEMTQDRLRAIQHISQDATLIQLLSEYERDLAERVHFFRTVLVSSASGILIRRFTTKVTTPDLARVLLLVLALKLGKPIDHQANTDSLVWDITPRRTDELSFKTFSEHNHEAPLHTDSQYSESPENFIGLLVFRKATCGGGKTRILNGYKLFSELLATDKGQETINILSTHELPFLIPPVFSRKETPEFTFAPVFSPDVFIRYRKDTLLRGLASFGYMFPEGVFDAVRYLDSVVENSPNIFEIMLEDGDLLITNNHTSLHARTEFSDMERLLFRVRFNF